MALKLKVLKVPSNRRYDDDDEDIFDPGEGTSQGPAVPRPAPKAEARTRHHIFNQSAVQG